MSSLSEKEKRIFEKILSMESGYVLDYDNARYGQLFRQHGIDIDNSRYQINGSSKAKKMRSFWEYEKDSVVGNVLFDLLEVYKVNNELNGREFDSRLFDQCRSIVARLTGRSSVAVPIETENDFLQHEIKCPDLNKLPVDKKVVPIIESRLKEAGIALQARAYLSVTSVRLSQRRPVATNCTQSSFKKNFPVST